MLGYTPNPRPRSNAELKELKAGAKELREWAARNRHEDPVGAERRIREAERNEADIAAEEARRDGR
ncbi:hypothetical protein ACFWMG_04790 [Streptomyces sp. NPDC127074]|uniref:hypothetical protein n=1 Tax=Streptomyces sp. NPDC127074 TaxID=3347130 RepID=UPI0036590B01